MAGQLRYDVMQTEADTARHVRLHASPFLCPIMCFLSILSPSPLHFSLLHLYNRPFPFHTPLMYALTDFVFPRPFHSMSFIPVWKNAVSSLIGTRPDGAGCEMAFCA